MDIQAKDVKQLRKLTGAGMMDCKKALMECNGDMEKAKMFLEDKFRNVKKDFRPRIKEGVVAHYNHITNKLGVMVSVRCETDFVARDEEFKQFANDMAMQVAATNPQNIEELLEQEFIKDRSVTIQEYIEQMMEKFDEEIFIENILRLEL